DRPAEPAVSIAKPVAGSVDAVPVPARCHRSRSGLGGAV
ncbi:MAG: hypothetical protein AVDCRST_MAG73-30, partial [uncultured Thermomicrobiales bacterium]